MGRFAKQLIFGILFLIIVGVPAYFVYRVLVPAPTCSDGIMNGQEEGVDCGVLACGVSCAPDILPIEQSNAIIIPTGTKSADILIRLDNPNDIYGASRIDYTLKVEDTQDTTLISRRGNTYVNPMQPRYLLFPLTDLSSIPASAQLQFTDSDVQWGTLAVAAADNVQFVVQNDTLTTGQNNVRYEATVMNRSTFTFDSVDVAVLLMDASGDIVGANSTVIRTLTPNEQRGFVLTWPFPISSAITSRAIVSTNLFTNDNFLKTYGSPERFQEY